MSHVEREISELGLFEQVFFELLLQAHQVEAPPLRGLWIGLLVFLGVLFERKIILVEEGVLTAIFVETEGLGFLDVFQEVLVEFVLSDRAVGGLELALVFFVRAALGVSHYQLISLSF